MKPPVGWWSLFVSNQLNELQMYWMIPIEIVLIWYMFLMYGTLAVENNTDYTPDVHFKTQVSQYTNYALKYFFTVLFTSCISAFIYIARQLLRFVFPLYYTVFWDLCCVSNLSLFIFDQQFHGYYIHGQFPGETSDVTLERLKLLLDEEETGDKALRGFINKYRSDAHLQTFEMFLSAWDRSFLNVIFKEESWKFHMSAK